MASEASHQIWLTSVINDDDVEKALTLCFSLKRVFSTRKVAVIVSNKVSFPLKQALHQDFDLFFYLEEDRNTSKLKNEEFAKLSALSLKSFSKIVYLEPTMMAIKNSDEIFHEQIGDEEVSQIDFMCPETGPLSIFAVRPSIEMFLSVMAGLSTSNRSDFNQYVRLWAENQYGSGYRILEGKFNCLTVPQNVAVFSKEMFDVSIINVKDIPVDKNTNEFGLFTQLLLEQRKQIFNQVVEPVIRSMENADISRVMLQQRPVCTKEPIAIVGMACRYPSANNLEEFWNLLVNGEDGTGTPPNFRWLREHSTRQVADCRKTNAGFLKYPVENFDAKFFGISPKEMIFLDPQHRLLHELVWEGLEDAALNPQELRGTNGGVFIGSWTTDYKEILNQAGNSEFYRMYMGNSIGAAAARISHLLELTGPSLATESGCSSAMVAVHLACKSLQRGETNFALACGVNLLLHPFNADIMPMVVSPDGHSKTFDAKADGFARAEGCGVFVLKRLSDAVRDGDKVWALIRGSGMTQEGVSKSMGIPTVQCESMAMKQALADAQVHPSDVSYVEAHGTGTIVGDPMEVAAIAKAYHSHQRKEPLLIGSVKTNVGHTESCSGITGIMKVVLAMQHEIIPPHRNFETLNPAIDLDAIPAKIPLEPAEWWKQKGKPRFAGVSFFGITGTDAHVILEEAPQLPSNKLTVGSEQERPLHIMKVTAKTEEALDSLLESYKNHFTTTECSMTDLAYTANIGRADFTQRAVIIAKSKEDAIQIIEKKQLLRGEESINGVGKICFLFTGQGSQYPGMTKQLYKTSPVFRMHFEYCEKILKTQYSIDITQVLWSQDKSAELSRTIYSQTSIFCVEYALLKLWESFGVKADFALGHSLGEFAAAVCAGILNAEDAIKLVAERSRLIDLIPCGKMLVINADKQRVDSLMTKFAGNEKNRLLDYAAVNSPEQTVVAGDSELILQFSEFCKQANLKCIVLEATHAFHSKHMDPILTDYRAVANTAMKLEGDVRCKYISGVRGSCVEAADVDADYWVEHTREKVLFMEASRKAVELGCKIFIDIGPQPVLSALTMMNNDTQLACLPSLKKNESEWETLLSTIGKLYVKGLEIDWKGFEQFYLRKKVALPHYPFIGKKFWPNVVALSGVSIHPLLGSVISNASSSRLFQSGLNLSSLEYVKDHAIGDNIIFPGAGYLEICLVAGLATVEGSNDSLPSPTRAMKVENLSIQAPLSLTESATCQLQTVVELNETGGDWNDMRVGIFRKMESESNSKWLSHAKATFSPLPSAEEKNIAFDISLFHTILAREPDAASEIREAYDRIATLGLKFGPTFRSIEKLWRDTATGTLLAKVNASSLQETAAQYVIHPVVADAMIQAVMMLRDRKKEKKLSVPIKIGKFIWLKGIDYSKELYINANQSETEITTGSSGSALLVSSTGQVCAMMQSVELIETTVKVITAVLDQQTSSMPEIYEEVWKPKMGARQFYTDMEKASGQFYTDEFKMNNSKTNETPPQEMAEISMEMDHFVYLNILRGMHELGWKPVEGEIFEEDSLFKKLGIIEGRRLYFGFILEVFEQEGVLEKVEILLPQVTWKVVNSPPSLGTVLHELSSSVSSVSTKFRGNLLFSKLGASLRSILKGEVTGLSIMFPDDHKADYPTVSEFYAEYVKVFRLRGAIYDIGMSWARHAKANWGDERMIVRILEVGSGTGAFSETFIERLVDEGIEFEYTYTDISASFFQAAEKRFDKYGKWMKFRKLNIEEDPLEQGFTPEYFDWVCAAEVIHATKDIRQSLQNIRMLMKPFAKLDIHEMTKVLRSATFSFGLLDGFWKFEDRELRPRHCTLSKQSWVKVLEETGFRTTGTFSTLWDYHSYICAVRTEAPFSNHCDKLVLDAANFKTWLVFHEDSHPVSDCMERKMKEKTLRKTISVRGGDKFEELTGEGNVIQFKIRKGNEKDYMILLQAVINKKLDIEAIVYCWALDKSKTTQEELLQPYFYLTKALLTSKLTMVPKLYAITAGTVPLDDSELSHFHSSTLLGFTRSLKNEIFGMHMKCIEVADGNWDEARMEQLFYEIWNLDKDILVAFQGNSRFVPKLTPHKTVSNALSLPKGTDRFQLVLPASKSISDLEFGPLDIFSLKENEVEVQVKASALNFRDVLSVIKPTEQFKDINAVGFDFSGVVKRIGAKVTKWQLGDLVHGCNMENRALPSHLQLSEELLNSVPLNMTLCEAATIPAVYMTSVACLLDVAKIKKEDVVLVHTASGGVGLRGHSEMTSSFKGGGGYRGTGDEK